MALPKWLDKGFVIISNHEPLSFRIRRGGQRVDEKEKFEYEHSEKFVKKAAEFGITCFRTHYFKGSGIEHEKPEMEMTKKFIKLCHKHGIKVQGYVQHGTLSYETLFNEVPDAVNWVARDQYGLKSSVTYGYQFFRYKPCYNIRNFVEYIKKVVAKGIEDGLDAFGFDNSAWSVEPVACQCDTCKEKFRKFLDKKYEMNTPAGKKIAWERFALDSFAHVQPPNWHRWAMPLNLYDMEEPMIQEWTDFKCETIQENIEEITAFAKKLKPDVLLEWNCYSAFGDNGPFWVGVDIYRNMKHIDAVWNEQDPYPGINSQGVLLNKIRSFRLFKAYGKVMFTDLNSRPRNEEELKISIAESLAFNSGLVCRLPGAFIDDTVDGKKYPSRVAYMRFSSAHRDIYNNTESAADTAVLESFDTLANTRIGTYHSLVAMYQTLIEGNVQYDILTLDRIKELSKYKLIILPNVKLLSDVHAKMLLDFVKKGGKLLATEQTGSCDEWFRHRSAPYFAGKEGKYGKGEIMTIAKIDHESGFSYKPEDWFIDPRMWTLPKNHAEILRTVKELLNGTPVLDIVSPKGLVCNLLKNGKKYFLHAINYDASKFLPDTDIRLNLPGKITGIEMVSPEEGAEKKVIFTSDKSGVVFKTGKLKRYKVFIIKAK